MNNNQLIEVIDNNLLAIERFNIAYEKLQNAWLGIELSYLEMLEYEDNTIKQLEKEF